MAGTIFARVRLYVISSLAGVAFSITELDVDRDYGSNIVCHILAVIDAA